MDPTKGAHRDQERTAEEVAEELLRPVDIDPEEVHRRWLDRAADILRTWKSEPDEITIDVAEAAERMYEYLDGVVGEAFLRDALHTCLPEAVENGGCDHDGWYVTREDLQQFLREYNICEWEKITLKYLITEITDREITSLDDLREGPEYQVGDVWRDAKGHFFIRELIASRTGRIMTPDGEKKEDIAAMTQHESAEKVATFRPSDDALDRVPEWVRGEVVESTNGFYVLATDIYQINDRDKAFCRHESGAVDDVRVSQRTGIVIDFHALAEGEK